MTLPRGATPPHRWPHRFVWTVTLVLLLSAAGARAAAPPSPPAPVRYLYLVRHGIYDRDDRIADEVGNGLNALGHEQARLTGERLRDLRLPLGRFVSSNYTRARETAADMGRVLDRVAEEDSLLHECLPTTVREDYMARESPGDIALCDANMNAAWKRYATPAADSTVCDVLVCHGNVIRWFATRALGVDTRHWSAIDIANASLTIISVGADGTTKLALLGDIAHVPPAAQTWTGRGPGWGIRPR